MVRADIKQGLFGRWFLFDPTNPLRAWSGSRWEPCTRRGIPTGMTQVCNFETKEDAEDYAAGCMELNH